jgi:hypothetical protein
VYALWALPIQTEDIDHFDTLQESDIVEILNRLGTRLRWSGTFKYSRISLIYG